MFANILKQSNNFYVYAGLALVWFIHVVLSILRIFSFFKSFDMRLNVRFVERGRRLHIKWGLMVYQIFASLALIGLLVYVFLQK